MPAQALTVNLPGPLYERLALRASRSRRTLEAEVVEAIKVSLPEEPDQLPDELSEAIASLSLLPDEDLWRAAKNRLPVRKAAALEALHLKRQSEGLTPMESEAVAALMKEYTRILLVRAKAAALLRERGQDVSVLLQGP